MIATVVRFMKQRRRGLNLTTNSREASDEASAATAIEAYTKVWAELENRPRLRPGNPHKSTSGAMNAFVANRLRSKPVEYTVTISHFCAGGEWQMSVKFADVGDDDENKRRVAHDLRAAADLIDNDLTTKIGE